MRKQVLTVIAVLSAVISFGQNLTNSPFSYYGIGEIGGLEHATINGVGNSTTTYFDSTVLNYFNPASYNTLSTGQPLFSTGISTRLSTYEENGLSNKDYIAGFNHFAMAFPIRKHFGLAFGLKPFSRKGYEIQDAEAVGTDSIYYTYLGDGGINEAFLGVSSNIFKFQNSRLAVGANFGYLFGESSSIRRSSLNGATNGGSNERYMRVKSFHYDLGMYFTQNITNNSTITLAASIDPSQKFNATFDDGLYYRYYSSDFNTFIYDTLSYTSGEGTITSASTYNLGLNYKLMLTPDSTNNRRLNSEFAFHLNYGSTDWSTFNRSFGNDSAAYLSTTRFTFGIQYTPEVKIVGSSSTKSKFYEKIKYRAGYYNYTLPYVSEGTQVVDQGFTVGFGIPVITQRSNSSVNLGFSMGNRGNELNTGINESYYGIQFGITIAPGSQERWFRKTKLN